MLNLKDGPAKGMYSTQRAPVYLRAVVRTDGERDVLDLVEDKPEANERVYIYEREGEASVIHLYYGGGRGRWDVLASYHFLPDVNAENARDNAAWQAWATARLAAKDKPRGEAQP